MTVTHTGWSLSDQLPERVVPSSLYDSDGWLRTWETNTIEQRTRFGYISDERGDVLPLYEITSSPFWHGYEVQCELVGRFGKPILFAGSTYSMYGKRGAVSHALIRGAHATAMEWIENGPADLLIVPNLTDEGVESWLDAAPEPVGKVLLERTYSVAVEGTFRDHLWRHLPEKIRKDVERRLRRSSERGLTIRMVTGAEAHDLVKYAYPLTVDTSDKNDWPALFSEQSLNAMLDVPGAMLVAAEIGDRLVGAFFSFVHGDEVTFMCGGIEYSTLKEYSTYIALMYGCVRWSYENGMRRMEWGRDNYRFKEKHGLDSTDLWALVYAPSARPDLVPALEGMHSVLSAYIKGV
ncbi:GNAT family N-acetyltransferase [Lentzea tibetensis]|uniref:GNAT family N-acetyltransferase n=1 Tax=Lentzea tibetensis TaxID=2591470 RepID=A0A563ENE0_9PSEU|nr:GNAT family N-acetyltransferase [Lentzea tibetensis]TWP48807.1 GNAT family N-acetyltransferase [Lentzea tibetensis]